MQQIFPRAAIEDALQCSNVEYRGTGSFGEVWRAPYNEADAAYKIIHGDGYDTQRILREIQGYRRVNHPNVVKLFDVQTMSIAGTQRPIMVFEFIPGCDLAEAISAGRPTGDELRGLAHGLLDGVSAMHAADLLHRDLKPANIALRDGKFDSAVILDLGLAKLLDVESVTRYPSLVGTTLYMAPEQLRGERALKASDLWAIGEILFEAATGNHPYFKAGEKIGIDEAFRRFEDSPVVPQEVPDDLRELITRCLSDVPHRRGTLAKAKSRLS
ncbi:serine/threonine protein kinase (plasmid) [Arthrobacter sp. FB24]|uniref:serine/threonine-protein kinase n=1 Tax=Arthrobacter sp. (strain FB24) TaxID=290399 RepID=UPI0000526CC7|nr:serine/threonine-protein kinase [Arthrobacter sp. FB24]ABK05862.1 serine/threonine protein kinase [Arthrobacter sp. FB24]